MDEIWKDIKGYEGYFEISNKGRVRSVERVIKTKRWERVYKSTIKKIHLNAYGYPEVTLCKDGVSKGHRVHRLLAEAFIPNPMNLPEIDHINAKRDDYRLENLRWCTGKENCANPITIKNLKERVYIEKVWRKSNATKKIKRTKTAPKTVYQYTPNGDFVSEYDSMNEAMRKTGINREVIRRVLDNNSYKAGGFLWTSKKCDVKFMLKQHSLAQKILQLDNNKKVIKEWCSISEASKTLHSYPSNIVRAIKTNTKCVGYYWSYSKY